MRLLPLLLVFMTSGFAGGQPLWRLSDPTGSDRGPAVRGLASSEWVLRIEARKGGEERTLFHDQAEDSVRLVDLDPVGRTTRVQEFRGGQAVWEVLWDPVTGLPREEITFQDNLPVETSSLEFEGRVLTVRTARAANGDLVYRDRLYRWPDGTLRRVERDGPSGPLAVSAWAYGPQGQLTSAWASETGGDPREWVFTGTKTVETRSKGTEVVSTRVTEWLPGGGSTETVTTAGGRVVLRSLDAHGRVFEESEQTGGVEVVGRHWTYDAKGRILEAVTEGVGPREVWTYQYTPEGTSEGRLTRNGVVTREESVREGEVLEVRLYDRGQLFLVETWDGGRKVKETFYQKGVVVRERVR